jgi:hypothetical protein
VCAPELQVSGLGDVRPGLERRPQHAPLTADMARTLDTLRREWAAVFHVGYAGGRWLANRKDGTGTALRGLTPDDLVAAIKAEWCSWPEDAR